MNICEVLVTLTHPGANDTVLVQLWLPLDHWNGRYIATGGSGWSAGLADLNLGPAVAQGYASASTDAGNVPPISVPVLHRLGNESQ